MHIYASLRMNDAHFAFRNGITAPTPDKPDFGIFHPDMLWNHQRGPERSLLTPQLWRQHPEYRIGESWPGSDFSADLLDYSHAEVRQQWLGIIEEIANSYDVDGIEMDFVRHPFFFRPSAVDAGRPLMTEFVSNARDILDVAGKKKGKYLGLASRCLTSLSECRTIGLDIQPWVQNGLIDVLMPSPTRINKFETDFRPFIELAEGIDCQILIGMDTGIQNITWEHSRAWLAEDMVSEGKGDSVDTHRRLLEEIPQKKESKCGQLEGIPTSLWRALAANALYDGADGVYLFNLWDQVSRHGRHLDFTILNDVRSPEALMGKDKLYAVDFDLSSGGIFGVSAGVIAGGSSRRSAGAVGVENR